MQDVGNLVQHTPASSSALPEDETQVIAPQPTQVVIPFQPLLEQISECLRFSSPAYRFVDEATNNVYVSVRPKGESFSYIYVGGPAQNPPESCENAAMQAVRDIMTKYRVTVRDFTYTKREVLRRCAGLYSLKRLELEELVKGRTNIPLNEEHTVPSLNPLKVVTLDYFSVLVRLQQQFGIYCTTLDTIRHGPKRFSAWITVFLPRVIASKKEFVSECFEFPESARSDLAKKVVEYVIPILNIEIIDANYDTPATNRITMDYGLERESFLAAKERVLGIKEDFDPTCLLLEEGATTPRALAFQIPKLDGPPPPPKKLKLCATCEHKAHVRPAKARPPRYFKVSGSVEAMFDRLKKA